MRIGIVTIDFPTVSETFIYVKVQQLAQRGYTVIVFCSNVNKQLFDSYFTGTKNVQVEVFNRKNIIRYVLMHPFTIINAVLRKQGIKKFIIDKSVTAHIKAHKPDILHIEFSGLGANYIDILKNLPAKTVVSCRGSGEKVKLLVSDERKKDMQRLFELVDAIHCVSGDMKQTILPYCSDASKIFINYPCVDTSFFNDTATRQKNDIIHILSVGRFTFQKGYLIGLLAIKKLSESFTGFVWTIVGSGPQHDEIVFHINQLQLQQHVVLAGTKSRSEMAELYKKSDIFFLTSVYEGVANAVLEAMSTALPVVATRSGGMEEVITDTETGFLADVYDSDTLAQHLLVLAEDEQKRKATGIKARQRILENFTIEKQTAIFETVYRNLVKH